MEKCYHDNKECTITQNNIFAHVEFHFQNVTCKSPICVYKHDPISSPPPLNKWIPNSHH